MSTANARTEAYANARFILRIMHQEISGAFLDSSEDADTSDTNADYFIITDGTWNPPWEESTTTYPADYLQFLTSSALNKSGALSEVGYWLDATDAQRPVLRRRLASDPTNYDSDPGTDYTTFDASDDGHKVLDMDDNGTIEAGELLGVPPSDAAKLATILGENVLAFNVEYVFDSGAVTAATGTTLTDDTKSWEVNQWADMTVFAAGQMREVSSNTATQLTVTSAWDPIPLEGTPYRVGSGSSTAPEYIAPEKRLTTAVRITLKVRDRRGRLAEGEEFVEIIHIKGKE
jgi:hypothetical protein